MQPNEPLSPATEPSRRRSPFFGPQGLRAGWGLLLFYVLFNLMLLAARFLTAHLGINVGESVVGTGTSERLPREIFINDLTRFLSIAIVSWIMASIEHRPVGSYGLGNLRDPRGNSRSLRDFLIGLGSGVVFLSLLVLILKGFGLLSFDQLLLHSTAILRYGVLWAVVFLVVALFEEYFLRGYIQFTLSRGLAALFQHVAPARSQALGFWTAALILSFFFGFGHHTNPGESPLGLLAAGSAGLVFCLSLWRTGSLWWAIGFHAAWDWAQSFLYGVADSGIMVRGHLFNTHPLGRPLLSGGTTGPEGSIFVLPLLLLAAVVLWWTVTPAPSQSPATES